MKEKAEEVLDAVATGYNRNNQHSLSRRQRVLAQLIVDAASGNTQGLPMEKKSDEPAAILKGIQRPELAVGKTVK